MQKEAISRNKQSESNNTPAQYDLAATRQKFQKMMKSLKNKKSLHNQLATYDSFYSLADGLLELNNVKFNRASLGPTMRACEALAKLLDEETDIEVNISRQKIQTLND